MRTEPNALSHLEKYLGPIAHGWSSDHEGNALPFQLVELAGPHTGTRSLATLGLSNHVLHQDGGPDIRQELITFFREDFGAHDLPAVLQQVALDVLQSHHALERGQLLGPRGTMIQGTSVDSFLVVPPVYLPDEFGAFGSGAEETLFVWLLPLVATEAALVREAGWSAFEEMLQTQNPDLTDLRRAPVSR